MNRFKIMLGALLALGSLMLGAVVTPASGGTKWAPAAPAAPGARWAAMPTKWGPWQYCPVAGHAGYETRTRVTGTPAGRWAPDQLQVRRVIGTTKTPPAYNKIMIDWYDSATRLDAWDYPINATTRSTTLDIDPKEYASAKRPAAKVFLGHGVDRILCTPPWQVSIL